MYCNNDNNIHIVLNIYYVPMIELFLDKTDKEYYSIFFKELKCNFQLQYFYSIEKFSEIIVYCYVNTIQYYTYPNLPFLRILALYRSLSSFRRETYHRICLWNRSHRCSIYLHLLNNIC